MNIVMTILANPLHFAAGMFLLVAGVWLLRKAGTALLAGLAEPIARHFSFFEQRVVAEYQYPFRSVEGPV